MVIAGAARIVHGLPLTDRVGLIGVRIQPEFRIVIRVVKRIKDTRRACLFLRDFIADRIAYCKTFLDERILVSPCRRISPVYDAMMPWKQEYPMLGSDELN